MMVRRRRLLLDLAKLILVLSIHPPSINKTRSDKEVEVDNR